MLRQIRRFKTVYQSKLDFLPELPPIPAFRILDTDGKILNEQYKLLPKEETVHIYKLMLTLNAMDIIMFDAQRQGRISFYMTSYGEEATHFGSASALEPEDVVFGQYREAGVLMYRGFTLDEFMNQCYGNDLDYGKGRQMPVHYGSAKLNFQTISSPLGTQIPQAAGAAFAFKREQKKNCVMCYFGEGSSSEGDFHYGLNFAATIGTPTLFFCRNNGYAISTPSSEQYNGDGIASRGSGYGIKTIRVDGNDVFAIHEAVKMARKYAVDNYKPVLIEAMTYRVGHHSTSDDSSAYRNKADADNRNDSPIVRLKKFMLAQTWWTDEEDVDYKKQARKEVLDAFGRAEKRLKGDLPNLFTEVYDKMPQNLVEQQEQMKKTVKKYASSYPLSQHSNGEKFAQ